MSFTTDLVIQNLNDWLAEASRFYKGDEVRSTSMVLATVDAGGFPDARVVLLKGVRDNQLVFFTNYESAKGRAIERHPYASLVFHWAEMERQIRVRGKAIKISSIESDAYFSTRARNSQLAAWASSQSQPIAKAEELAQSLKEIERRFGSGEVPRPPHWGGYAVIPNAVEFWAGKPGRLHHRELYSLVDPLRDRWERSILSP